MPLRTLTSHPLRDTWPGTRVESQHSWADTGGVGLQGSARLCRQEREGVPVGPSSEGARGPLGTRVPLHACDREWTVQLPHQRRSSNQGLRPQRNDGVGHTPR